MKSINKASLYAIAAILMWSTVASSFKIALNNFTPELTLFYASLTATVILFIIFSFDKSSKKLSFTDLKLSSISGLFNPFIYYLVLFEAYSLLPAQIAQPLNYTWPIVLTIFSSIIFKYKLKYGVWIGLIVSFIGVILISNQSDSSKTMSLFGIILAIGSSVIWSIYWILNMKDKRANSQKLFMNFLFGSLYIFIYIFIRNIPILYTSKGLMASIYIGFFEMGITFFIWMKALELSSNPSKINNLVFLSPFISFIFIAVILKETVQFMSILGLFIIVLGIFLPKLIKF